MDGEERRDQRAAPGGAGQAAQRAEQEDRAQPMKQHIGRVEAARIDPEQLGVEHVRQPGDGVPIRHEAGGERPAQVLRREPCRHPCVLVDVAVVVEDHEVEGERLPEDRHDEREQCESQPARDAAIGVRRHRSSCGHGFLPRAHLPPLEYRRRSGRC